MSILLPDPKYLEATFAPLDFGGLITPGLGGPVQRVNRLGNRTSISYTLRPLYSPTEGRIYVARLMRGRQEGVRVAIPQSGMFIGSPGKPVVNGAIGAGINLPIKTLTPTYTMREGQPLTVTHGGIGFLHWFAADYTANASGVIAATIYPPLRTALSDGDSIEIGKPYIEGWLSDDSDRWSKQAEARNPISFTVTEGR